MFFGFGQGKREPFPVTPQDRGHDFIGQANTLPFSFFSQLPLLFLHRSPPLEKPDLNLPMPPRRFRVHRKEFPDLRTASSPEAFQTWQNPQITPTPPGFSPDPPRPRFVGRPLEFASLLSVG